MQTIWHIWKDNLIIDFYPIDWPHPHCITIEIWQDARYLMRLSMLRTLTLILYKFDF